MRPRRLIVITGTGTEVGKTWVASRLISALSDRGLRVAARKPVQSFASGAEMTDADVLAESFGGVPDVVCPPWRSYPLPMAPPMAAAELGLPVPSVAELAEELKRSWPCPALDAGVVEGAGGVASPIAGDGDTADLARRIGADVAVVVAGAGLGVINAVRLSVATLAPVPTVVFLNRFEAGDRLHVLNREWLAGRAGVTVTVGVGGLADLVETDPGRAVIGPIP